MTTDFVCQPFAVENAPAGYTARELISYIAASHGANARFSADEVLQIKPYTQTGITIDRNRCYDVDVAVDGGTSVQGILFDLGGDTHIYIDDDGGEYDSYADGIVECYNPLATVEIAEYAWSQLGGLTCSSCSAEMPAENILEPGDIFSIPDSQGNAVIGIVMEQQISVSCNGGFVEKLGSTAENKVNQRTTSNRITSTEKDVAESGDINIENAVIIQQTDIKHLLHEYTQIGYAAGNKVVYGGVGNSIVVDGYVFEAASSATPSARYGSVSFGNAGTAAAAQGYTISAELQRYVEDTGIYYFRISVNGTLQTGTYQTKSMSSVGFYCTWSEIRSPAMYPDIYPYGCSYGYIHMVCDNLYDEQSDASLGVARFVGFASEAEYNAAIGLTYEPETELIEVQETVTEVTDIT